MTELVQLEAHHAEFAKRNTQVVVISLEKEEETKATQLQFPHLVVVSDAERSLAEAVKVIHKASAPDGGDTTAPTTILVDGSGVVRWTFRPERFFTRLTPGQVLAALDEHMPDTP